MATSFSLLKPPLKTALAEALYNEIITNANSYYYFLGKPIEWVGGETSVVIPDNSIIAEAEARKDIVFLKKITSADVAFTVPRYDWVSGQVYDMYDDATGTTYKIPAVAPSSNFSFVTGTFDLSKFGEGWLVTGTGIADGTYVDEATPTEIKLTKRTTDIVSNITLQKISTTGATSLDAAKFYVLTNDQNVYKCLDNNNGAQSISKPYSTTHETIQTADGYIWKYMYTIPNSLVNKFTSIDDIPVTTSVKSSYYSQGALNFIQVLNPGSGYLPGDSLIVTGNGHLSDNAYRLIDVTIDNPGSGYTTSPAITITPPYDSVAFETETLYLAGQYINVDGRLYRVDAGGVSDTFAPIHTSDVSVTNGTTSMSFVGLVAEGSATITDDSITDITLTGIIGNIDIDYVGRGYDYNNPPLVTISGDGFDASAVAVVSPTGYITKVEIVNRGTGYTSCTVSIDPPDVNSITIDGSSPSIVDVTTNSITSTGHEFTTGAVVIYYNGGGSNTSIEGLTSGAAYYIIAIDANTIKLAGSLQDAVSGIAINITAVGTGSNHTISDDASVALLSANIYYGYGYNSIPSVQVDDPVIADVIWAAGSPVDQGDVVKVGDRFYEVTSVGTDQILDDQAPTHTSGIQTLGTVSLSFVGQTATLSMFTTRTSAQISPVIENGQIIGVSVQDPGIGYTAADIIVVGTGSGASLVANLLPGDLNTRQANTELLAIPGTIDAIDVLHPGLNYVFANVAIEGDGQGCTAEAVIQSGAIVKITVTDPGFGYTFANVVITGNSGAVQAYARPIVSPVSGHGKDAIKELFSKDISLASTIALDKNQGFVVDNDYRQLGVIKNPTTFNSTQRLTKLAGSTCFSVTGNFVYEDVLTDDTIVDAQGNRFQVVAKPETEPTSSVSLLLQSIDNVTPIIGGVMIYGSSQQATIEKVINPTVDKYSGEMLFIDNRTSFQPTPEQTVSIKTVIRL